MTLNVVISSLQKYSNQLLTGVLPKWACWLVHGWIFIDAGHRYEEVSKEWELYSFLAARGAVVAFQDIYTSPDGDARMEVDRMWAEIRTQGYLVQELTSVNPYPKITTLDGCGIGIVYLP